jgi:hypothetical protein
MTGPIHDWELSSVNVDDVASLEMTVQASVSSEIDFIWEGFNFSSAFSFPSFSYSEQQARTPMYNIAASLFDADSSQIWATAPFVTEISPEQIGIVASKFVQSLHGSLLTF